MDYGVYSSARTTTDLLILTRTRAHGHTSQMIIYVFYVDVENDWTFESEFFALVKVIGPSAEQIYETMRQRICSVKDKQGKASLSKTGSLRI